MCDEQDANNFDYHSFFFAASYLMINDLFLFHLLKTSGSVSFIDNDTLLPALYSLLTLDFLLPQTLSWFESKFPHYNLVSFLLFYTYIFAEDFLITNDIMSVITLILIMTFALVRTIFMNLRSNLLFKILDLHIPLLSTSNFNHSLEILKLITT